MLTTLKKIVDFPIIQRYNKATVVKDYAYLCMYAAVNGRTIYKGCDYMKLYRFIGEKEYNSLLKGEKQFNNRDWSEYCDTTSKGICFFAYNRTNNIDHIIKTVLDEWCFSGIVKEYAIVEINVEKARKAKGFYASGYHTEYNLFEYDINNVVNIWTIPHKTTTCKHWKTKELVTYTFRDTETKAINTYKKG